MRAFFSATTAFLVLLASGPTAPAVAQTEPEGIGFVLEGYPLDIARKVAGHRDTLRKEFGVRREGAPKGVAAMTWLWSLDDDKLKITVCVDTKNGTVGTAVRKLVVEAAMAWTKDPQVHIPFDFGLDANGAPRACSKSGKPEDIRVYFGAGIWSLIGSQSIDRSIVKSIFDPSMQLQWLDRTNMNNAIEVAKARRIIMHEFGHALGLEHEHQHPRNACANHFDDNGLGRFLHELNWDRQKFNANFALLADTGMLRLDGEAPDPDSIMYYKLPRSIFDVSAPERCAIKTENMTMSSRDLAFLPKLYPKALSDRKGLVIARQNYVLSSDPNKAAPADLRRKGQQHLPNLFGPPPAPDPK